MSRVQFEHELFQGDVSGLLSRELFDRGDSVALLPYDPVLDEVLLVEQFRLGAVREGEGAWLIEPIAGMIEVDERPEEVARREAKEEAALEIEALRLISEYYCSPGGCNEKIFLYCAQADLSQALHHDVHGLAEEGEDIRVHRLSVDALRKWYETGAINSAMTLIAVQWLLLNHTELQRGWL